MKTRVMKTLKNKISRIRKIGLICGSVLCLLASSAFARDVEYVGKEVSVYVTPGEPTQITLPDKIEGGFKRKNSALALERNNNFLVVFAQPEIPYEGEALLVHLKDKRSYALRILPADDENKRDEFINVQDNREGLEDSESGKETNPWLQPRGFPSPSTVPGFVREMILIGEFGKRGGITGYRRSNKYTGEIVLNDGTVEAKIAEIFMGTDFWGYVLDVENLLDTNLKINPASFRLDGTRAVAAERWELAARPYTAEQKIANAHKGKVYIVTKALRR